MNGHSNSIQGISVIWADAVLEQVKFDYSAVIISLREEFSKQVFIKCEGYIGVQVAGLWDEMVIETVNIYEDHPFQLECLEKIKIKYSGTPPLTGDESRNQEGKKTLVMRLSDGCELFCCATRFIATDKV